jgi:mono/diheme cytochrome c family protein
MSRFANQKLPAASALFTILLAISACERGAPTPPAGLLSSAEAQQAGSALFAANCAICHGVNRDGYGQRREGMTTPPANLTMPPWSDPAAAGQTFVVIRDGVRGTAMPSWRILGDERIWQLVAFITSSDGK